MHSSSSLMPAQQRPALRGGPIGSSSRSMATPRLQHRAPQLCPFRSAPRAPVLQAPGSLLPITTAAAAAAAAPEPFVSSLSSSDAAAASSSLARIDDLMAQSFAAMDPFGGPPSSSSLFPSLQQQLAEMDRGFDAVFADVDRMQRAMDAELAAGLRRLQEQEGGPAVSIERREERGPGSYRFYESISIRSGGYAPLTPATTHAPFFSPLLFAALLLAGAWAAVTAAFNRNFALTPYKEASRWRLLATWPVLALTSSKFAAQLGAALRGERLRVTGDEQGSMDGGSSGGGAAAEAALLSRPAVKEPAAAAAVVAAQEQQEAVVAQPSDQQQQPDSTNTGRETGKA